MGTNVPYSDHRLHARSVSHVLKGVVCWSVVSLIGIRIATFVYIKREPRCSLSLPRLNPRTCTTARHLHSSTLLW